MSALLSIALICFVVLFGTALAAARHLRVEMIRDTEGGEGWFGSSPPRGGHRHAVSLAVAGQSLEVLALRKEPDWRFLVSGDRSGRSNGRIALRARRAFATAQGERSDDDGPTFRGRTLDAKFEKHLGVPFGTLSDPR